MWPRIPFDFPAWQWRLICKEVGRGPAVLLGSSSAPQDLLAACLLLSLSLSPPFSLCVCVNGEGYVCRCRVSTWYLASSCRGGLQQELEMMLPKQPRDNQARAWVMSTKLPGLLTWFTHSCFDFYTKWGEAEV